MDSLNRYLLLSVVIHVVAGYIAVKSSSLISAKDLPPKKRKEEIIRVSLVREYKRDIDDPVKVERQKVHKKSVKGTQPLSSEKKKIIAKARHGKDKKKTEDIKAGAAASKPKDPLIHKRGRMKIPVVEKRRYHEGTEKVDGAASAGDLPISLNTKDTLYFDYFARIKEMISEAWAYPEEAFVSGFSGKVRLKFTIDGTGALIDVAVVRSSEHTILDYEAVSAVKRASPYGPIPKNIRRSRLPIIATFNYFPTYNVAEGQ